MWSRTLLKIFARVVGERGELRITNPVMPQLWHKLVVTRGGVRRVERLSKRPTYEFQLQAFCDAVLRGAPTLTPPSDAVANMRVIDAIYRAAGMHPRQPSA
jgi:predicted dehydrogenase